MKYSKYMKNKNITRVVEKREELMVKKKKLMGTVVVRF